MIRFPGLAAEWTSRWLVFLALAGLGCAIDLWTKSYLFRWLNVPLSSYWLVDGIFGFELSLNEGALWGIGQGRAWLFALLSIVAGCGILCWLGAGAIRDWLLTVALGLIMAGIAGNLYDRLGCHGLQWSYETPTHHVGDSVYAVRDWIHFKIERINFDFPIFNLADSCLVVGGCLLALHAIRHPSGTSPTAPAENLSEAPTRNS